MTAATRKKVCNKCGSETTSMNRGYAHWYTDPLYTSLWLCHRCYFDEDTQIWGHMRKVMDRIKKPRSMLRKGK